jgi:hypothetical protein
MPNRTRLVLLLSMTSTCNTEHGSHTGAQALRNEELREAEPGARNPELQRASARIDGNQKPETLNIGTVVLTTRHSCRLQPGETSLSRFGQEKTRFVKTRFLCLFDDLSCTIVIVAQRPNPAFKALTVKISVKSDVYSNRNSRRSAVRVLGPNQLLPCLKGEGVPSSHIF